MDPAEVESKLLQALETEKPYKRKFYLFLYIAGLRVSLWAVSKKAYNVFTHQMAFRPIIKNRFCSMT